VEILSEAFIGIDTSKSKNAVALSECGRDGQIRYLGVIDTTGATAQVRRQAGSHVQQAHILLQSWPDWL